jgi:hypothetical protein
MHSAMSCALSDRTFNNAPLPWYKKSAVTIHVTSPKESSMKNSALGFLLDLLIEAIYAVATYLKDRNRVPRYG